MEVNTCNIAGNYPMLLTSFLKVVSQSRIPPKYDLAAADCPGFVVEFYIFGQPKATQDLLWYLTSLVCQKLPRIYCGI